MRFSEGLICKEIWLGWLDLNQRMTESESSGSWLGRRGKLKKANYFFEVISAELTETDPIRNFFLPRLPTELVGRRKVTIFRYRTPN